MSAGDSVSQWIRDLKAGDDDAPNKLWNRYFDQLVKLARGRLGNLRRVADEEDVAVSVFKSLCRGAEKGNFSELTDRGDLWALLLTITKRKAVNHIRRETAQKRGGGRVHGESVFGQTGESLAGWGLDQIAGEEPTPEFVTQLGEEHERLFDLLHDERLQQIATYRMEGYSTEEIAERLNVTDRTVRRKLNLIREKWANELDL